VGFPPARTAARIKATGRPAWTATGRPSDFATWPPRFGATLFTTFFFGATRFTGFFFATGFFFGATFFTTFFLGGAFFTFATRPFGLAELLPKSATGPTARAATGVASTLRAPGS